MPDIPALTGRQLLEVLKEDGWSVKRRANHGLFLTKRFGETVRVTVVKDTTARMVYEIETGVLGGRIFRIVAQL